MFTLGPCFPSYIVIQVVCDLIFFLFNPLQGEDAEEAGEGGEEKGEGKKRRKKRSKKAVAIEEDEQEGGKEEEEEPSLIDIGSRETSPAPTAALATKTESPRKKSPARDTKKEGEE